MYSLINLIIYVPACDHLPPLIIYVPACDHLSSLSYIFRVSTVKLCLFACLFVCTCSFIHNYYAYRTLVLYDQVNHYFLLLHLLCHECSASCWLLPVIIYPSHSLFVIIYIIRLHSSSHVMPFYYSYHFHIHFHVLIYNGLVTMS